METFHPSRTAGACARLAAVCCSSGRPQSMIQPTPPTSFDTAAAQLLFVILFLLLVGSLSGFALDSDEEEAPRRGKKQATGGLDPSLLAMLPVVPFDAEEWGSKGRAVGVGWWECPVCLTDFGGGDGVRLLPGCGHGFHAECIDAWLAGNVTCPVCRHDLAEQVAEGGGEADLVMAPAEEE